ncbi:MAG: hypothetical protein CVU85_06435 [Firmicutes bacterium HGW-Firmicutes-10]|jgi:hypothetical protein|nr:MAG: hypothetical protein CVU85_06435 [Firmicutes bacterium HGW-Firmicutes-10]
MNNPVQTYKTLFNIAVISGSIMLMLIPIQIFIFASWPPPTTTQGFFDLYNQNPLLGLLSLDFLYIINNVLIVPLYLAIAITLKNHSRVLLPLALILGFIGIAAYYPTNPAFEFLVLAPKYALAPNADKVVFLAAGETLLANYIGTAFNVYYVLNAFTLISLSVLMLKSRLYTKTTSIIGLTSGIFMIIPSTAGIVGLVFSLLSLIPWIFFVALLINQYRKTDFQVKFL